MGLTRSSFKPDHNHKIAEKQACVDHKDCWITIYKSCPYGCVDHDQKGEITTIQTKQP